jgi:hypothetical protein
VGENAPAKLCWRFDVRAIRIALQKERLLEKFEAALFRQA